MANNPFDNDMAGPQEPAPWTYLSNHSHVLICLARQPDARIRDVAAEVRITERAVQKILQDLEEANVLERHRVGRRNLYRINPREHLRHPVEGHCTVAELLTFVLGGEVWKPATKEPQLEQE